MLSRFSVNLLHGEPGLDRACGQCPKPNGRSHEPARAQQLKPLATERGGRAVIDRLVDVLPLSRPDRSLARVTLNDPERLNALTWQMYRELYQTLTELDADPMVRVIVITGAGRAFSAGGDLKAYQDLQRDPVEFPRFLEDAHSVFDLPGRMSKPVLSLVNGVTAAGGLELVLACDFALMARSAKIGDSHLTFGQMGGGGVLTRLPRFIGPARARELIFSARFLDSTEALEWGIVNRVVDDDQLFNAALELAEGMARTSALALANAKHVINTGYIDGTGMQASLRLERERTLRYCLTAMDAREGLAAFAAKRDPSFLGY